MTKPEAVGLVIGTDDATPLEFWVAVSANRHLQLDDIVALERILPNGETVSIYGIVTQIRARHEGARFDSDVFLIADGILPAEVSEAAKVQTSRVVPETFVPPLPGTPVRRAVEAERDQALDFEEVDRRLAAGLSRDDEPIWLDFDFIDGTKGAHINISGISGVATKTSYATFLLYSLFTSGVLGAEAANTKGLVFNAKGEDLTLSGGETFLASLALALALADNVSELAVSGAARLDSIFLDEGFGTLDGETLEIVASAIEELGAGGRMVGIVTHIRDLADRMPVRFEVSKHPESSSVERVEA